MYCATRIGHAVTTSNDVFEITAPASNAVVIHSAFLGQSSDAGDASAEMLRVQFSRHTASSAGGSSVTPLRLSDVTQGIAFGGTVEVSNAWVVTNAVIMEETFNVQAGWYYTPTPEERIVIPPSGRLAMSMGLPADSLTMSARITFEAIG
jgi:hypothetical protein